MNRTIRMQPEGKVCSMWTDSTDPDAPPDSSILLAELHFRDPHESLDHYWYWCTASCVFAHWLGGVKLVGSLDEANVIGLGFLRYLEELQELLGQKET